MAELRKCPFCGGEARIVVHHNEELSWVRYAVECYRCNTQSDKYRLATLAEEAWNRRVGESVEDN